MAFTVAPDAKQALLDHGIRQVSSEAEIEDGVIYADRWYRAFRSTSELDLEHLIGKRVEATLHRDLYGHSILLAIRGD